MNNKKEVVCTFKKSIYSLDTVKKAAYKFTNRAYFSFDDNEEQIICTISNLSALEKDDILKKEDILIISEEFKNEVLDQDLRKTIFHETEDVRNIILAKVFSKTKFQDE